MTRTMTAIALLLAVGGCNRGAQNNSANTANASNGAVAPNAAAPAPPPQASAANAAAAPSEQGDVTAGREKESAASAEESAGEGCAGEIGLASARELVEQCVEVSPATRPPCNIANSCQLIQDEIERGCGMLAEDAPAFCSEG